jgi:hypothetical protein
MQTNMDKDAVQNLGNMVASNALKRKLCIQEYMVILVDVF